MKKILIAYATAGIGHKKAAIAVKKALDGMPGSDAEVIMIDALDHAPKSFKDSYLGLYLLAMHKLAYIWGLMYYLTDNYFVNLVVSKLRRLNNWVYGKELVKYVNALGPDVIVSTHFFASEVLAALKRKGLLKAGLITIVTDYRLHSWWVSEVTDTYIVSNEDAKLDLIRWKVTEGSIRVMGMPVEPIFSNSLDRAAVTDRLGLERGLFTALVIGGGFGVGPIEDIVKVIGELPKKVQAVVICGRNEELVKKIASMKTGPNVTIRVLGFVDNVYEYMSASDILISKSGGITVSESLVKELPMVVISPMPGQETGNASFLLKRGACVQINKFSELKGALESILSDPAKIGNMKAAIRKIRVPTASHDIAKFALDTARGKG